MTDAGFDWQPLMLALITGSGGGLLGAWLQHSRQTKADTLATEVAKLSAKKDLRALADEAIGEVVQTLRTENQEIRERITRLETRNDELVRELAAAHRNLRTTEEALLDTERQLLAAEQAKADELAAKDRTITMLQEKIGILQNTITELRAQVDQLTQALADCAKHRPDTAEPCPLLGETD